MGVGVGGGDGNKEGGEGVKVVATVSNFKLVSVALENRARCFFCPKRKTESEVGITCVTFDQILRSDFLTH